MVRKMKNIKFEILIEIAGIIYGILVYLYYTKTMNLQELKTSSIILFFSVLLITHLMNKIAVKKQDSFRPRAKITIHHYKEKNKKSLKRRPLDFRGLLSL